MKTTPHPALNGATLRVIAQSLGLYRALDLALLLDRNERTVKRWFTDERPISQDVSATLRRWQQEMSQRVNETLDKVDEAANEGRTAFFTFERYPNVSTLRRHRPESSIVTHSSETWDAYLGRVISVLEDQGIPYTIQTILD